MLSNLNKNTCIFIDYSEKTHNVVKYFLLSFKQYIKIMN